MATGTVKWFSDEKGYGFITPDEGSKDLFVHFSNIAGTGYKTLNEGDSVEFEVAAGKKGDEAQNVRRRLEADKEQASSYAAAGFARDMLAIKDHLDRALANASLSYEL